jgi:hypothetical protein
MQQEQLRGVPLEFLRAKAREKQLQSRLKLLGAEDRRYKEQLQVKTLQEEVNAREEVKKMQQEVKDKAAGEARELAKLAELEANGILSRAEFRAAKEKVLGGSELAEPLSSRDNTHAEDTKKENEKENEKGKAAHTGKGGATASKQLQKQEKMPLSKLVTTYLADANEKELRKVGGVTLGGGGGGGESGGGKLRLKLKLLRAEVERQKEKLEIKKLQADVQTEGRCS